MLKRNKGKNGTAKVTFVLPETAGAVSVVGEFNDWDPGAHPLKKRANGTRSVVIDLRTGAEYIFRYMDADGTYFDEIEADAIEPNGFGETHSLLRL